MDRFRRVFPAVASKTVEDVLFSGLDVRVERVSDASDVLVGEAVRRLVRAVARTAGSRRDACTARANAPWMSGCWDLAGSWSAAGAPVLLRPKELFPHNVCRAGARSVRAVPPFQHRAVGLATVDRGRSRRPSGCPAVPTSAADRGPDAAAQAADGASGGGPCPAGVGGGRVRLPQGLHLWHRAGRRPGPAGSWTCCPTAPPRRSRPGSPGILEPRASAGTGPAPAPGRSG